MDEKVQEAVEIFKAFLDRCPLYAHTLIISHSDADGVGAGAIMYKTLERLGFKDFSILITGKGQNAYTPLTKKQATEFAPERLFVLDLGCKEEPVVPGVPTLFIDHHRPYGVPPEGVLVSSYHWDPIPNTSLLTFWLCRSIANIEDLDWVAAIGTLSDLGDKAPFDIVREAKEKYKAKWLKEATALVNAARRSSSGDASVALRAVLKASHPREIVEGASPEARLLHKFREESKAALEEAKKASPRFRGNVALVEISTPCYVHPLVAQIWRTRLPKYIVIVANHGYIPGYVAFSVRTAADVNVLDFLGQIEVDVAEGYMGYGHDQASSGVIPFESWKILMEGLGFRDE
ncbi:MAG: phosphoesterase [Anaerolineae bacterium]|nr:phosphoesterase [Anaerolineae bacterium]